MAAGFGYLATGGQHGDLTLKDIKGDFERCITSSPGCTINNGLCFSRCLNGEKRLLVSNNDTSIRVYSVPDLMLIDTLNLKTSVNNTSVSPDGEKMVAVGDDNSVLLFNISYSGRYELAQTMAGKANKSETKNLHWYSLKRCQFFCSLEPYIRKICRFKPRWICSCMGYSAFQPCG
ncbi:unnamed protein product [Rhizopus stolonifer]